MDEAQALLQTMVWPGNVRQLKNVIERVLILGQGTGPITAADLPSSEAAPEEDRVILSSSLATLSLREARELFEREYLLTQINRFGGNISRTASFVGMERSALHRKLKSLGVVTTNKSGARVAQFEGADKRRLEAGKLTAFTLPSAGGADFFCSCAAMSMMSLSIFSFHRQPCGTRMFGPRS